MESARKINVAAIKGDRTGYEGPDGGPFYCKDCKYFEANESSCVQEDMKRDSPRPRNSEGDVMVDAGGCCPYHDLGNGQNDNDADDQGQGSDFHGALSRFMSGEK